MHPGVSKSGRNHKKYITYNTACNVRYTQQRVHYKHPASPRQLAVARDSAGSNLCHGLASLALAPSLVLLLLLLPAHAACYLHCRACSQQLECVNDVAQLGLVGGKALHGVR